jgi:hypothetical protein
VSNCTVDAAESKKGLVPMMQRWQLTSSAAKAVAARRASTAREDHLKLTIVPDSGFRGEKGVMMMMKRKGGEKMGVLAKDPNPGWSLEESMS